MKNSKVFNYRVNFERETIEISKASALLSWFGIDIIILFSPFVNNKKRREVLPNRTHQTIRKS